MIFFNWVHPSNANDPIDITDDGMSIFWSVEHSRKRLDSNDLIDFGIWILESDEHPKNKLTSITVTEGRIDTWVIFEH